MFDRDTTMKAKGKEYADHKRHAKQSDIDEGDNVLAKRQIITNKLNTVFEPTVFKVIERKGSEATIINTGTNSTYRRNVAHLKKVHPEFNSNESTSTSLATPHSPTTTLSQPAVRPQRERKMPQRYTN